MIFPSNTATLLHPTYNARTPGTVPPALGRTAQNNIPSEPCPPWWNVFYLAGSASVRPLPRRSGLGSRHDHTREEAR
ncbi:hypothetical protein Ssi03_54300 [Sphaerisporangium siamense]|nr:hypothetical protein Ssi03_54300 [Sphaerisporangium siamense]